MPTAFAQPGPCDAVLVPSVTIINERRDVRLSIFKLVTRDNYEQSQQAFSALVPGYFEGTYDQFNEKRQQFYSQEMLDLTVSEARGVLMTAVPEYAVEAWKTCMAGQAVGQLQAWVSKADENSAIVRVRFIAGQGHDPMKDTLVSVDPGVTVHADDFSPNDAFDGEASIHVIRPQPYAALKGSVSGTSNGGAFSADFYVPRMPQLVRKDIVQDVQFGTAMLGTFTTPSFSGRAELLVHGSATATWQVKNTGIHWVHCVLRKDGTVFHYTGEKAILDGQTVTATTNVLTLDATSGQTYKLQVDTNNDGAKADALTLHIRGWKEVWE